MSLMILLDAGPLGMITNPKSSPESEACKSWLVSVASNGVEVMIPEIAGYEVRRELLRAGKDKGIGRLDALKGMLGYVPITTPVMLKAAEFWAAARTMGRQSANDASLDADMILAIVNGDDGAGFTDLIQVLTGNAYCESGEVIPMYREYSEGRIREEKL